MSWEVVPVEWWVVPAEDVSGRTLQCRILCHSTNNQAFFVLLFPAVRDICTREGLRLKRCDVGQKMKMDRSEKEKER